MSLKPHPLSENKMPKTKTPMKGGDAENRFPDTHIVNHVVPCFIVVHKAINFYFTQKTNRKGLKNRQLYFPFSSINGYRAGRFSLRSIDSLCQVKDHYILD